MNGATKGLLVAGGAGLATYLLAKTLLRQSRWFDFEGRAVLIIGGSRGLGLVLARHLVERGAKVAIAARTEDDLKAAQEDLERRGGEVLAFPCDARDRSQVDAVVQRVLSQWGQIDVLMYVAGIIQVGPLEAMTIDDFHDAMDTHCWGALHAALAVLPHMRRRGWGRIVNIASIGGIRAVPHLIPYVASKFALVGLSNGLRMELAKDNILVTTICPTLMRTGSHRQAIFKGQHRQEYTWFSIGGAMPGVAVAADHAAEQILTACQRGDRQAMIWTNPLFVIQQALPDLSTEILTLINRLLPEMGGIGQRAARGYESETSLSPSWLTALGERAARENNEMRPHPL
jgi:NAD(P)-dependent dehydrogenase (short-subunit alcohol dehydrogenase family)